MNKFLIISFKSRNDVYSFHNFIKKHNIVSSIVNSPSKIGSSCMLAIKTDFSNLNFIIQLLNQFRPASFFGVFSVQQNQFGNQTNKLL